MAKNSARPPALVWKGANYARVPEGGYQAVAVRHQGPEWIRPFARWSLLIEFQLLDDSAANVCAFYNFGNDRNAPKIGRRGNYFKAWTLANGELPRKGQEMSPDVFMEGQVFTIDVKDSSRNSAEKVKTDAEVYSVVTEIVSVERPSLHSPNPESINQKSLNQKSRIMQSHNQAVNQSGWPAQDDTR
jgi:hypothetical protein